MFKSLMFKSRAFSSPRVIFLSVLCVLSINSHAQQLDFSTWLENLRAEATALGIGEATLDSALTNIEPLSRVLELDKSQPEFTLTFTRYMGNSITSGRVDRGRDLLQRHGELLRGVQATYAVQPHYLVSFWGLESNFGDYTGGISVISALATLAWDPRRSDFFRRELLTALRIIDAGHISAAQMSGSWAGAMGQLQFMPSTFEQYAVDGDGDGRIDIWNSLEDVFASAANYLSSIGWKGDERWGREVLIPDGFDFSLAEGSVRKTLAQWDEIGIRQINSSRLPQSSMSGSIVVPAGASGPAFLTYDNFQTTLQWNRSIFYAVAVGHLANRFTGGATIQNMPENEQALSRDDVIELQQRLNDIGIDAGTADGILGSRTRRAVRDFQKRNNLPADGYASQEILAALR